MGAAGEWKQARESYLASADAFQQAFHRGRSTTPLLDGGVHAASNAGGGVLHGAQHLQHLTHSLVVLGCISMQP